MGENGDQVLVDEGELAVRSNGTFTVFDLDNDSCCCNGTDPPDPDPDDKYCPTVSPYPNAVKVNLGAGWEGGEDFWIPREDYMIGRWMPPDGSFPRWEANPDRGDGTVHYFKNIGAVKSGDDFFGVQKWELRNSGWRNHSGDVDLDMTALPLTNLVSGQTYQLQITVSISFPQTGDNTSGLDGAPAVQVQVMVDNAHNTHSWWPWCFVQSFWLFSVSHSVQGLETQHWKEADHPVGTYDFSMTGDLAHRLGFEFQDTGGESTAAFAEFVTDTYACTVMIPAEGFEPKRPRGGTYERTGSRPQQCREPYHAQLGTNGLSSNSAISDSVPSSQFSSWLMTDAYNDPDYNGIDPLNKYAVNPDHWQVNHTSQLGLSGSSGEWRIGSTTYGDFEAGGSFDTSVDWKAHSYISNQRIPYDIRSEVKLSFSVRSLNFDWKEPVLGYWNPETVNGKTVQPYSPSFAGVRVNQFSAQLRRYFARRGDRFTGYKESMCVFASPQSRAGGSVLESLNTGGDFGMADYAPEGTYDIVLKFRWVDRDIVRSTESRRVRLEDYWELSVIANGNLIEVIPFTWRGGTYFQNHWDVEIWGDNINSMNPETPVPTLSFQPWSGVDPPAATAATNSNDAFNTGITFECVSDAEHIDTKFVGNFPPYAPSFHYVTEDPENPNEFDLELQVGQTYTFPVMAEQEFENSNRRFVDLLKWVTNGGDQIGPVGNGFSLDRKTGTITWTPEYEGVFRFNIEGVSGFDQWHSLHLKVKIGSGGGEDPPA